MKVSGPAAAGETRIEETPVLDQLPVFVRPGTILPRQAVTQSTAEIPAGPLQLDVYPGPDCHGALYWDDGWSRRRENGEVLRQTVRCVEEDGRLRVIFEARVGAYPPWWKSVDVTVHGVKTAGMKASLGGANAPANWDAEGQALHVLIPDQSGPATLTIG